MSFGGGGGGNQTVTQEFKPPEYTKSGWQDYINAGKVISQTPYQQSGLATVAPINDYQNTAMQLMYNRALYGAPDLNAARGAAMQIAAMRPQYVSRDDVPSDIVENERRIAEADLEELELLPVEPE